jgi:hypothetical protein
MAINIEFSEDQTERLLQALETAAYSYCYATGYLSHAESLAKQEEKDNPLIVGTYPEGSYSLSATFPEQVKQVTEMDEESLTKLLRSVMRAAKESGVYDNYISNHLDEHLNFTEELKKQ